MINEALKTFILNKQYKTSKQFNSTPRCLQALIKFLEDLPIQKQSFDIIYELLKFYRTPLFIACQPFYQKIKDKFQEYNDLFSEVGQKIAAFVKSYIGNHTLDELAFFYIFGISNKKRKEPVITDKENEFIVFIENLGAKLNELKEKIYQTQVSSSEIEYKLENIFNFMQKGIGRSLNALEENYVLYFRNKIGEYIKLYEKEVQKKEQQKHNMSQRDAPLCCREYFQYGEVIRQSEDLTLQYKQYRFPTGEKQIQILRKTVCAFLNQNGGTIILGIKQDVETKKRIVQGTDIQIDSKQEFIKSFRTDVILSIKPDISGKQGEKLYKIIFLPIIDPSIQGYRNNCFIIKVYVKYGKRDEIYSYCDYNGKDNFSFRTENEVIHRYGRQVVTAYRQRLKNPLPIPLPTHKGTCMVFEKFANDP